MTVTPVTSFAVSTSRQVPVCQSRVGRCADNVAVIARTTRSQLRIGCPLFNHCDSWRNYRACGPWSMDQFVDHGQHLEVPPRATSHPSLAKLGARVRQLRKLKKWTQEDLAAECRLDRSYISGL